MANKVELKIGGDTADLEKAFSNLIKKIQSDADKLKITSGMTKGVPTGVEAAREAANTSKNLNQKIREERAGLDIVNRELSKKQTQIERILKLEKEGLDVANQRLRAERDLQEIQSRKQILQTRLNQSQRTFDSVRGGAGGRGKGPGAGGLDTGDIFKGVLGGLGVGISAAAVGKVAKDTYDFFASEAARTNLLAGSATQANVGYLNQKMLSGDIAGQTLLQNQVPKGRELATQEYNRRLTTIFFEHLTAELEGWGLTSPRRQFETKRAKEIGEGAQTQAQALLAQNNPILMAQGFFQQTFNRNLGAERGLGLGTDEFKRMQMQLNNRGFLTDQGTALLGQVQGAGGATSGAQAGNIANLGLSMQRGLNLTNAGNILGKLSGVYGNTGAGFSKMDDASKRILEEAITKGFDKSENTEIIRKFTETTSGLMYQTEAKTGLDIQRITSDFARLLSANPTQKQFEAAQTAYQEYQGLTSQTTGRGGALGFAAMQNKNFSKLSPMQVAGLMEIPENMLTGTNSRVIAAAAQQGMKSPQDMVTALLEAKRTQALGTVGFSQKQLAPLQKYLGGRDVLSLFGEGGFDELKRMGKSNPAAFKAFQELQTRAGLTGGYQGNAVEQERIQMLYGGAAGYGKLTGTAGATAALGGTRGKKEEEYVAAQAAQEKQLVLNLKALEEGLYPTTKGISDLTQAIINLGNAAHILNTGELGNALLKYAPVTQVQTRSSLSQKPSNGSKPTGANSSW